MKTKQLMSARRLIAGAIAALLIAAGAQNAAAEEGFSFAAYGDSRPMMYVPMKAGKPDLVKLFVEMFGLVMPEKVAEVRGYWDVQAVGLFSLIVCYPIQLGL